MNKYSAITSLISALALLLGACTDDTTDEQDPQVGCERLQVDQTEYCVYEQPITETGYDCPSDLMNPIPLDGHTVCSATDQIPAEHERPIREHFDGSTDPERDGGWDGGDGSDTDSGLPEGPIECFELFPSTEHQDPVGIDHRTENWHDFGVVPVGEQRELSIRFYNFSCNLEWLAATEVLGVEWASGSAPAGFEVTSTPAIGSTIQGSSDPQLTIQYAPTSTGTSHGTLVFRTRGADYSFQLLGEGFEEGTALETVDADCITAPATVDFGTTTIGSTATETVTLELACEPTFHTEHVVVESGQLAEADSTFAIETAIDHEVFIYGCDEFDQCWSEPIDIEVSFTPTSSGAIQETMTISTNDRQGSYDITLEGAGAP